MKYRLVDQETSYRVVLAWSLTITGLLFLVAAGAASVRDTLDRAASCSHQVEELRTLRARIAQEVSEHRRAWQSENADCLEAKRKREAVQSRILPYTEGTTDWQIIVPADCPPPMTLRFMNERGEAVDFTYEDALVLRRLVDYVKNEPGKVTAGWMR